jgi:predicted nucleic acid-binding protein
MEFAVSGFFHPLWSAAIHDEWIHNLQANRPDLDASRLQRTRDLMNRAVPEALVTDYEHLTSSLILPDPDDRHVLAAAIHGKANGILTFNLRHFPSEALAPFGITAQSPDTFLTQIIKGQENEFLEMARLHRARLVRPPKQPSEYAATLRQCQLSQIADLLERNVNKI